MSTFITYMIDAVLLITGHILLLVKAWRGNETIHWVLTFLLEVASNIIYFVLTLYFNAQASMIREHMANAPDPSVPYARFAIICLMVALFFLGMTLISIIMAVGRHVMANRGEM